MTRELLEAAAAAAFRQRRLCVKENAPFPATVPKIWQANLSCENRSPGNTLQRDISLYEDGEKTINLYHVDCRIRTLKKKNCSICDII